ncbi:TM0106 family RecB-like putative nuclease [[Mycobacterium] nativiensis]|uniref:TM0106 family RecB-like putative nuclease n=1 Tax=[Mycobacterium] nativiensis TaxID=2855503 RepID=A0ABU5XVV1_9MYCO|nr:TM0106 family RecB-like putative nuclease [Mycolicibacter sp. MYC340]MEB3032080.1 TM0106 family RecB-like putative nuclease [Mycolicibacter sp. MYC340]
MIADSTTPRLMTPSKITAWLDCAHYLTLRRRVDNGALAEPDQPFGSFARLLTEKGLAHEHECLAKYRAQGKTVLEVDPRRDREAFADWVQRIGNPFTGDVGVVYQMPFVHNGIRGIADFVERIDDHDGGAPTWEPVDAKLTRFDAKPGHVLQLCFYADAIEALTGHRPKHMHIRLGSGAVETLRVDDFGPYWRRLQTQLYGALDAGPDDATVPQPCAHCQFCEFSAVCEQQWRSEDSLFYVAGIRSLEITALAEAGVATMAGLAQPEGVTVDGVASERMSRLVAQAALQVQARLHPEDSPPFSVITPGEDPVWGHGLEQLPPPDNGDIFLDFEGHPFWRADVGLFFLFGALERDGESWRYRAWWAHDRAQEATAVQALVDHLARRREQFPGMHIYHYNHTECSALQGLADCHQVAEVHLAELVATGAFIDLYIVARNSIQAGVESYGLKYLELLTDFQRRHDIDKGAGAVVQYECYMADGDPSGLDAIAAYNEDDVRATLALRDWLVDHRPSGLQWRAARLEPDPGIPELDERVAALHAVGPDTVEHLLGDVLGYWRREWLAYIAPKLAALQLDPGELLDNPEALGELQAVELVERPAKTARAKAPAMRFRFPPQVLDRFPRDGGSVMFVTPDNEYLYLSIDRLDREGHTIDLVWNAKAQEAAYVPRAVALFDWVDPKPKALALQAFADTVLDAGAPNPVTMALLRRELPRFTGGGPAGGVFTEDLGGMTRWVTQLDHSYVAIQGPPGTGKTYRGAHLVHALIMAGFRVGITAMSHHAITNLLQQTLAVFTENGDLARLSAVRNPGGDPTPLDHVVHGGNDVCARSEFNLVAGTTWLFSSKQMQAAPVDVLLIDEAGQLALADALAASCAAKNLALLGDPLQLPQVAQAVHPGVSGRSVLEHVLGDDVTLPSDRGVFLSETRRMHPDVCDFISAQIYQGRLRSYPDCSQQTTVAGTGLRWLRAEHHGNGTWCAEEADLITDELLGLIGTDWTNQERISQPLGADDFMVVAPYNDQVHTIRDRLARDARTADVAVGTVDKFQGREAAVVFYSMTTSSGENMTRSADFLFSRNRLNVAVSRARCLAYLVCTEELLNTRARTVDDMRLISTLNAFAEYAGRQAGTSGYATADRGECGA